MLGFIVIWLPFTFAALNIVVKAFIQTQVDSGLRVVIEFTSFLSWLQPFLDGSCEHLQIRFEIQAVLFSRLQTKSQV